MHIDGKGGGRTALDELFLSQYKSERAGLPAAELLRRGHGRIAGLFEPDDILKRKAALAVVLFGPFGKLGRKLLGDIDNALLVSREIEKHDTLLRSGIRAACGSPFAALVPAKEPFDQ